MRTLRLDLGSAKLYWQFSGVLQEELRSSRYGYPSDSKCETCVLVDFDDLSFLFDISKNLGWWEYGEVADMVDVLSNADSNGHLCYMPDEQAPLVWLLAAWMQC